MYCIPYYRKHLFTRGTKTWSPTVKSCRFTDWPPQPPPALDFYHPFVLPQWRRLQKGCFRAKLQKGRALSRPWRHLPVALCSVSFCRSVIYSTLCAPPWPFQDTFLVTSHVPSSSVRQETDISKSEPSGEFVPLPLKYYTSVFADSKESVDYYRIEYSHSVYTVMSNPSHSTFHSISELFVLLLFELHPRLKEIQIQDPDQVQDLS